MALDQVSASAASGGGTGVSAVAGPAATGGGLSFRTFLSDINPLQYIPVVGAVYRAVTGDEGNSTLRFVASLGTSFALGGPVGLGVTVAEKVTGIDPERIARSLLSRLLHHGAASTTAATATPTGGTAVATTAASSGTAATATGAATANAVGTDAASRPWSAAELSAYAAGSGSLSGTGAGMGASTGASRGASGAVTADTLNAMELQRVNALYA